MAFICGSFHQDEDDLEVLMPMKRSSRRSKSFCSRSAANKNPYANRGLDKFTALLAELDEKRQKILTQKGSEDISLVRFVYPNPESNNPIPIVVKLKEKRPHLVTKDDSKISCPPPHSASEAGSGNNNNNNDNLGHKQKMRLDRDPSSLNNNNNKGEVQRARPSSTSDEKTTRMIMLMKLIKFERNHWNRPSYYLPVFTILILVFLAFFGRSFAILCTSLSWYMVPMINGSFKNENTTSSKRRTTKNAGKTYKRRPSEKISSPRSVLSGPETHRKSF